MTVDEFLIGYMTRSRIPLECREGNGFPFGGRRLEAVVCHCQEDDCNGFAIINPNERCNDFYFEYGVYERITTGEQQIMNKLEKAVDVLLDQIAERAHAQCDGVDVKALTEAYYTLRNCLNEDKESDAEKPKSEAV